MSVLNSGDAARRDVSLHGDFIEGPRLHLRDGTTVMTGYPHPRMSDDIAWREARRAVQMGRLLIGASDDYNCMGLVFAARRACLDIGDLREILRRDGYQQIAGRLLGELAGLADADARGKPTIGDVLVYRFNGADTHVGLLAGLHPLTGEPLVLSKWGRMGEFLHKIADVPTPFGHQEEVWRLGGSTRRGR